MEMILDFSETRVLRDQWDVDARLGELGLDRKRLLKIRDVAYNARGNATPHHCANAGGTFSYQYGVWALRDQYVVGDWSVNRDDGVESIKNDRLGIKVAFSNVDVACNDTRVPRPRTDKGAGSERASQGNLFGHLPLVAPKQSEENTRLYYVMVDERGAIELTCPVVRDGTFVSAIERLYLDDGDDRDDAALLEDNSDMADDFNPQVVRK